MTKSIWKLRVGILSAMLSAHYDLSRLHDIGRLRSFRAVGNLELYLLSCPERLEAIPHNP